MAFAQRSPVATVSSCATLSYGLRRPLSAAKEYSLDRCYPALGIGIVTSAYCPEREINITPRNSWGKKRPRAISGGCMGTLPAPSSSNNCKNTSKNSSSNPPARPPPARCCWCFCCCCCCCWGAGSVPIHPPEIVRGCFFPPAVPGRDAYLSLGPILSRAPIGGATTYKCVRDCDSGWVKKSSVEPVQSRKALYNKKCVVWIPGGLFAKTRCLVVRYETLRAKSMNNT